MGETKVAAVAVVALIIGLVVGLFIPYGQLAPAGTVTKTEAILTTVVETHMVTLSPSTATQILTTKEILTQTQTLATTETLTETVTAEAKADVGTYLGVLSDISDRASQIARSVSVYDADSYLDASHGFSELLEELAATVVPGECVKIHKHCLCGLHYGAEGYRVGWLGLLLDDPDIIELGASLLDLGAEHTNAAADLIGDLKG